MATRVTQVSRRVLNQADSNARVTQVSRRVLNKADSNARVTQISRRVLIVNRTVPGQSTEIGIIE